RAFLTGSRGPARRRVGWRGKLKKLLIVAGALALHISSPSIAAQSQAAGGPLATPEQIAAEKLALEIIALPDVRAAREQAWERMMSDPLAKSPTGRLTLDRSLDQWTLALAMRSIADDTDRPAFLWTWQNAPHSWFGHTYTGGAAFIDSPDNVNRDTSIDGDVAYEIHGRFGARPTQFTLQI